MLEKCPRLFWAEGPHLSASRQSPIFTPRQVACLHPALERGVPSLLHPQEHALVQRGFQLAHKLWWVLSCVCCRAGNVAGRTQANLAQNLSNSGGGRADLKMMMPMATIAAFLRCFWVLQPCAKSWKAGSVTLPWEGQGSGGEDTEVSGGDIRQ